jgi:hypothetical protein
VIKAYRSKTKQFDISHNNFLESRFSPKLW